MPLLALLLLATVLVAVALARDRPSNRVEHALRLAEATYAVPYSELRAVAWCESRWHEQAKGSGSYGLFQFLRSTWARTPYRGFSVFDPDANALAAGWLWKHDKHSWREWTCRP